MTEEQKNDAVEEKEVDLLEEGNLSDLFDFPEADAAEEEAEPKTEEVVEEATQPEEEEAETETVEEETPQPEQPAAPESQEAKFKYRGKEYSFSDLQKDQDLFTKVITGANQQSHYQELYERQRQEAAAVQQQLQQLAYQRDMELRQMQQLQQRQEDPAATISPDVVKGHYNKQLDTMVKEGWIEEDVKELYPNVATGMLYLRDTLLNEVAMLKRQVAELQGYSASQYQESVRSQQEVTKQQVKAVIENIFNNIAAEGGIFEPLKDRSVRTEFIHELQQTVNPEIQAIIQHPTILRDLWVAKNHATILQAAAAQKASAQESTEKKRRLSSAEGAGSASAGKKGGKKPVPGTEEGWGDLFE